MFTPTNSKRAFALLLTCTCPVLAPSAELTGKVTAAANGRGLAGAIVYVVSGVPPSSAPPQRETPTLAVRGGRLDPHVLVVKAGESFTVTNADRDNYNFHVLFRENTERNKALMFGSETSIKTDRPELFARVSEDLGRLHGYVCVLENRIYSLTDVTGAFRLPDLPAGTYTIEAAHPREGRFKRKITVGGASAAADFALPGPPKTKTP